MKIDGHQITVREFLAALWVAWTGYRATVREQRAILALGAPALRAELADTHLAGWITDQVHATGHGRATDLSGARTVQEIAQRLEVALSLLEGADARQAVADVHDHVGRARRALGGMDPATRAMARHHLATAVQYARTGRDRYASKGAAA